MHRRPEFSFPPGSPARGPDRPRARPPVNAVPPRPAEEEEVRWLQASQQGSPDYYHHHSHDSSGTPSPQLWEQHHRTYPASAGTSPSRAQAIAGYRREMLDLVRGLPESAYELSLRDIVEHQHHPSSSSPSSSPPPPSSSSPLPTPPPLPLSPPLSPPAPRSNADVEARRDREHGSNAAAVDEEAAKQSSSATKQITKQGRTKQRAAAVRRQRSRSMERSVSLDTGLLIKFFMPLSIGGKKKKVSPKPDSANKKKQQGTKKNEEAKQKKKHDQEWWTKSEFSEATGSSSSSRTSSTGSSNSNSSNGSVGNGCGNGGNPRAPPLGSRSRKRNGCYAFLRAYKSKNGVSQD